MHVVVDIVVTDEFLSWYDGLDEGQDTFDPSRQAVLLIGGDKTGNDRFYREFIPVAEGLWETYLKENES